MHKSEVAYQVDRKSRKGLKSAVEQHIYPPAIHCIVVYSSPPDCSRGATMIDLNIEVTDKEHIPFPLKVYEIQSKLVTQLHVQYSIVALDYSYTSQS